jgi:hypothetical protein
MDEHEQPAKNSQECRLRDEAPTRDQRALEHVDPRHRALMIGVAAGSPTTATKEPGYLGVNPTRPRKES